MRITQLLRMVLLVLSSCSIKRDVTSDDECRGYHDFTGGTNGFGVGSTVVGIHKTSIVEKAILIANDTKTKALVVPKAKIVSFFNYARIRLLV